MQQGTAMATASKLLLLILCSYHSFISHAGATGSLKPEAVCSEAKGIPSTRGATARLHHRHGPCSPVPSKKVPTLEELLRSDELRASYIQRKFSGAANRSGDVQPSEVTVPTTLGSSLDTLEYVITVGLGTPAATQTMMIDTGSDVSWVQCKPCSKCHSQVDPLFDPSSSSSYSAFPCSSAACAQLGKEQSNGCSDSQCQYVVHYGDRSKTTGTYSSDTLTLGSDAIKGFQFGCSHAEAGFDDKTDGLMGLGGGAQSLVSQTAATLGEAFSYCLPPPTSSAAGFLTLGAASSTTGGGGSGFVTTGMHRSSQVPTYYMVRLEGIMVGGKKLSVAPSVFSGGSVMDSGTIVTRLPAAAYSALSSAFRAAMARQYRPAPPRGIFDTCFDLGGQSKPSSVTTVAFVFDGGAVVNFDLDGIMMDNCLAFAATDEISIIGNVQQRTFEVLYDVGKSTLGFRAGAR